MAKSPKVTQLSPYTSASCPSVRQVSIVDLETAAEAKIDKIKIKKGRKKDKKVRKIRVFEGNFENWGGWR